MSKTSVSVNNVQRNPSIMYVSLKIKRKWSQKLVVLGQGFIYGGGGFFLACEDFGRMFDSSFPTCAFVCVFFCKVEISLRTPIPLFWPGSVHSSSVS